jgi:hypothetical protein
VLDEPERAILEPEAGNGHASSPWSARGAGLARTTLDPAGMLSPCSGEIELPSSFLPRHGKNIALAYDFYYL